MKAPDPPASFSDSPLPTLAELGDGKDGTVSGLATVAGMDRAHADLMVARLRDIGFVPGARCQVVARMWPGGDPIAVRVGGSTFALRRAEAGAVLLQRWGELPATQAQQPSACVGQT